MERKEEADYNKILSNFELNQLYEATYVAEKLAELGIIPNKNYSIMKKYSKKIGDGEDNHVKFRVVQRRPKKLVEIIFWRTEF